MGQLSPILEHLDQFYRIGAAEFTGMIWESLTQMLGAKIKLTSPYYPQGNSVIERSHRTLSNMLRGRSGFLEIVFVGECEVLVCL